MIHIRASKAAVIVMAAALFVSGLPEVPGSPQKALASTAPASQSSGAVAAAPPVGTQPAVRASVADGTGAQANAGSYFGRGGISSSGRYVVFTSSASNLIAGDTVGTTDLFVRDTGTTRALNIDSTGLRISAGSAEASITPDGRFVAFGWGKKLTPTSNDLGQIYLRDRDTDSDGVFDEANASSTVLVSRTPSGSGGGHHSTLPQVTPDGRYVVFQSRAANLVTGDTNQVSDIFVWDRLNPAVTRVSLTHDGQQTQTGGGAASRANSYPSISDDGRLVAFESGANNIVEDDPHFDRTDVYVRDRDRDGDGVFDQGAGGTTTVLASADPNGVQPTSFSSYPAISGDGRWVAYKALFDGLNGLWATRVSTGAATWLSVNPGSSVSAGPDISANGRFVAWATNAALAPDDTNGARDHYLMDRDTDADGTPDEQGHTTTARVSVGPYSGSGFTQTSTGNGQWAAVTDDGRYVAFDSTATNILASGTDTNSASDVFRTSARLMQTTVAESQTFGSCGDDVDAANPSACHADPVNTATGAYTTAVADIAMPGIGMPFSWTRTYTSADATSGDLGQGWTHPFAAGLTFLEAGDVVYRAPSGQRLMFIAMGGGAFSGPPGGLSTLSKSQGTYELARRDGTVLTFSSDGRIQSLADRNDNAITLAYGQNGLTSITDTANRVVTVSHDGSGRIDRVALPDGRAVTYGYTGGLLTSVTDVRANPTTYAYNAASLLTDVIDQNDHTVVSNAYGPDGRVTLQTDARGNASAFTWDRGTGTATMTDARGHAWKDVYEDGALVKRIDPLQNTTLFSYDQDLNVVVVTDPRGNATTMDYDSDANLMSVTGPSPLSYVETFTYTAGGDLRTYTNARNKTWTLSYDAKGNVVAVGRPDETSITTTRDAVTGLPSSVTDARGKTTVFAYDADGNLASVSTPLGHETTYGHDQSGRLISVIDPRGNEPGANPADYTSTMAYDPANHQTAITDPLGNTWSRTFDAAGNLTSSTDPNAHTIAYDYDDANALSEVIAPDLTLTSYAYDATGNLTQRHRCQPAHNQLPIR